MKGVFMLLIVTGCTLDLEANRRAFFSVAVESQAEISEILERSLNETLDVLGNRSTWLISLTNLLHAPLPIFSVLLAGWPATEIERKSVEQNEVSRDPQYPEKCKQNVLIEKSAIMRGRLAVKTMEEVALGEDGLRESLVYVEEDSSLLVFACGSSS